ncbi:MAG: alpha/beta hydrolase [Myxococcales bacterium]|nr:MAG: alpha/beta hydrolase [Myxococcales bacterium]
MASLFDAPGFTERLFFPRPDRRPPPPGARDLRVVADDGVALQCRVHEPAAAAVGVVLFPGNGEAAADYDALAASFGRAGASLAVASHRGYGRSEGRPSLRRALRDAPVVLAAVAAEWPGRPLVAMGRSLGSACAAELGGRSPSELVGVVIESGFSDLRRLIERRGLTPPAHLDEADERDFGSLAKVAAWRGPLLVLHGTEDEVIGPDEALATHRAAGPGAQLHLVVGRGHNDLMQAPDYWAALGAFLARVATDR